MNKNVQRFHGTWANELSFWMLKDKSLLNKNQVISAKFSAINKPNQSFNNKSVITGCPMLMHTMRRWKKNFSIFVSIQFENDKKIWLKYRECSWTHINPNKMKCGNNNNNNNHNNNKKEYMIENQSNERFRNSTKIDSQRMYMRAVFLYHLSFAMCNYECDVWSLRVCDVRSIRISFLNSCALENNVIAWRKNEILTTRRRKWRRRQRQRRLRRIIMMMMTI